MNTTLTYLFILVASSLMVQKPQVYSNGSGAINGFDPVAYFAEGKPVQGMKSHSFDWHGASWQFSSQKNLNIFKSNPEKYAPQFGGYCAYAVAHGLTAKTDLKAWKIVAGKLYLNYDNEFQKKWEANQSEFIKKGQGNWPSILNN